MAAYEFSGTVKAIMDLVTFDSGFCKREFVVTSKDDKYPQDIKFECVKERTALLDDIEPGQQVAVSFDLRGNEYKDRYFVNLAAWKVVPEGETNSAPATDGPPIADMEPPPQMDGDTEIPF
jgi:single-strand DNA-binding protein